MSTVAPWEVSPALERSRLLLLARFAVEARRSAVADARRADGDTNWGIGCRAYERFIFRVTRAATSGELPWLDLWRDGLSLTIVVEGVLVRAYTGRADKPDLKHVMAVQPDGEPPDDRQLALPFLAEGPPPEESRWVWLMAVETDALANATRVTFFQADPEGRTRNAWDAPMAELAPAEPAPKPSPRPRRAARTGLERPAALTMSMFGD